MKSSLMENSMREYLGVIFRRKSVIITTFITVMITVVLGLELKTPIYESSVKMLVSARKGTESLITRTWWAGISQHKYHLPRARLYSYAVLERVVRVLKLNECSLVNEKDFCSPIKSWGNRFKQMFQRCQTRIVCHLKKKGIYFRDGSRVLKSEFGHISNTGY